MFTSFFEARIMVWSRGNIVSDSLEGTCLSTVYWWHSLHALLMRHYIWRGLIQIAGAPCSHRLESRWLLLNIHLLHLFNLIHLFHFLRLSDWQGGYSSVLRPLIKRLLHKVMRWGLNGCFSFLCTGRERFGLWLLLLENRFFVLVLLTFVSHHFEL